MDIIELQNLNYNYPHSEKGLKSLSLTIEQGSKTAILGLNGAGKSTLFGVLCGIIKPQSGLYFLKGKEFLYTKKNCKKVGDTIGYLFQDPDVQLFAPSVFDDVAFGLQNKGYKPEEINHRVLETLKFMEIEDFKNTPPHELSYGQKKLVAIAGVLVMNPEILILDEPFAWLDVVQKSQMKELLDKFHQQGITILLSTHNIDFAQQWADKAIFLNKGTSKFIGKMSDFKSNMIGM